MLQLSLLGNALLLVTAVWLFLSPSKQTSGLESREQCAEETENALALESDVDNGQDLSETVPLEASSPAIVRPQDPSFAVGEKASYKYDATVETLLVSGEKEQAEALLLDKASSGDPLDQFNLATFYAFESQEPELATEHFIRGLVSDPEQERAYAELQQLWHQLGDRDRAVESLREVFESTRNSTAGFHYGNALFAEGRFKEARNILSQVDRRSRRSPDSELLSAMASKKTAESRDQRNQSVAELYRVFRSNVTSPSNPTLASEQKDPQRKVRTQSAFLELLDSFAAMDQPDQLADLLAEAQANPDTAELAELIQKIASLQTRRPVPAD